MSHTKKVKHMGNEKLVKTIEEMSHKMRLRILDLTFKVGKNGAHVGGSLSIVEILATLYKTVLKINLSEFEKRDRLILSKGHAALALYCVLENVGILTKEETETFEENGSNYIAHAKRDIAKGLEFSGGSLGLGISFAVGVALACKSKNLDNHIYVVLGDGECDEGLVWEALMAAKNYNLVNMTMIVDCNHLQIDGFTKDVMNIESLKEKFIAFGYHTIEIDGHSVKDLLEAFEKRDKAQPNIIIANTIKGKGVSFMENKKNWHHNVISENQYCRAKNDIKQLCNYEK